MLENWKRIYYCEDCKRTTPHNVENGNIWLYSCQFCGEIKTIAKFKSIFKS
jgi:ribosomal protein L37AE/L43A